jgi:hypothetical protein
MILKFGKYKDQDIKTVPDDYLAWLIETQKKTLSEYQEEQERRAALQDARRSWAERLIQAGYRALANKHHPDHGGNDNDMLQVTAAKEKLKTLVEESGMM